MLQNITTSRYSRNIQFQDPITKHDDLNGYLFMINMLNTLFAIDFKLHKMAITGEDTLTARYSSVPAK